MSKVRINDLARELEVKSKAILDTLPLVGVTEKKTHSSSLEEHEAEKVRVYLRSSAEGSSSAGKSSSRASRGEEEIKTKIDLSNISRPGDVLKAITQRKEAVAPAAPLRPAPPPAAHVPAEKPATIAPPVAKPVVTAPAASVAAPPRLRSSPVRPVVTPPAALSSPASSSAVSAPVRPARHLRRHRFQLRRTTFGSFGERSASGSHCGASGCSSVASAASPPRMIVPQTGPRPVYKAPLRTAPPPVQPGVPIGGASRPLPGRPVPGQPIFQRRPPWPGRLPVRRVRRCVPVSGADASDAAVARGSASAGRWSGASASGNDAAGRRPGGPARRPGQRYVPRGVKEGPMKGYTPPPRMVVSNEPLPITRSITITEGISVKDLAEKLEIRAKDLISRLLSKGVFATINQTLDAELASEMARFFGADTNVITFEEQTAKEIDAAAASEESVPETGIRPPVVTIMGHVDHGKTTLLDSIRLTNVAEGEAGGITQHIGAYKVRITDKESPAFGREIVFLDTPGHEAFTRMRSRGAKATDIVVLVVAADDGVMPQTLEAIDHAHAAEVPIIVAVNKIDKPDALPDRVKKQLADRGLVPEEWGGKTVFVDVSAKKKTNLNLLMEMICLVADLGELKATPERAATGVVLEAKLDRGRGPVATVLVQNGTLNAGDNFVVGNVYGKVRAMFDDRGAQLKTAPPSTPVEIIGMEALPQAGDQFVVVADRDKARGISEYREQKVARGRAGQEFTRVAGRIGGTDQGGGHQRTEHDSEGRRAGIGRSDHRPAHEAFKRQSALEAAAFGRRRDHGNRRSAGFGVERDHHWLQRAAGAQGAGNRRAGKSRHPPALDHLRTAGRDQARHERLARAYDQGNLSGPRRSARNVFRIPKVGTVAGCRVSDGLIKRDSEVRLLRDNVQVFKGKVGSLRRFKDDASQVTNGMECGISIANYGDIKVGDVIEAFVTERIAAEVIA